MTEPVQNPLRVCIVVLDFAPTVGGAEARAEKQARELQALGHEVTIYTIRRQRSWPQTELMRGLSVERLGGVYRRNGALRIGRLGMWPVTIDLAWKLWKRRAQYDVIHVFDFSPLAAAAAFVAGRAGKPIVISFQSNGLSPEGRRRLEANPQLMADTLTDTSCLQLDSAYAAAVGHDALSMNVLGGSALVRLIDNSPVTYQCLSSRSRDQLLSNGFPPDRVVHISGSVNTVTFRPNPALRPDPAARDRTIVCVARHDYSKGIDVLLHGWNRMMGLIARERPELHPCLWLVGDGRLRPQLECIAQSLGITDSIEFMGTRSDVLVLLQQAWGFVLPSRWEGMPNALLEAMACGLPSVATRVSGSEDIIDPGIDGLLVDPESPVEMAEALYQIVQDTELAGKLGKQAREKTAQNYALNYVVGECVTLYRGLLLKHTHGQARSTVVRGLQ